MPPILSSSMQAGDADVCGRAPFPTATVDVDMTASGVAEGRQAVVWRRRGIEDAL